jgi:hypothetical protein
MILTASVGAAGFLFCAWLFIADVDFTKLVIGMIYLAAESALCAIFTLHSRAHQYIEYISRTELERDYATDPLTCSPLIAHRPYRPGRRRVRIMRRGQSSPEAGAPACVHAKLKQ